MSKQQLNQAELETLFELSLDLLCMANVDGFFHRINPAFTRVLGHDENELLDHPFIDFVHPDDREATLAALGKLSNGSSVVAFENRYRCKNGEYKTLQWNATPDRQSDLIAASARDVSVENALRLEVENSRELRALGIVATTVAHDMNNILTPILTMSELLLVRNDNGDTQTDEALKMILSSAVKGVDLVGQILSFSEEKQTAFAEVDLENIIQDVVQRLGIEVKSTTDIKPNIPPVNGNATQLFQIVMNLCQNATQAMTADSVLQINLFCREIEHDSIRTGGEQHVVFEVINDGSPIPVEVRKRIFDPFFTTRKDDGGHGLGTGNRCQEHQRAPWHDSCNLRIRADKVRCDAACDPEVTNQSTIATSS